MIRKKKGSIEWLEFELLQGSPIKHGVFLRQGGTSSGAFSSLNMSSMREDDPKNVEKNRKALFDILQLDKLISAHHVHGTNIALVEADKTEYSACDGLMTDQPGLALLALHADCQATLFYDPLHKAVACVHAGWRGQVKNIYSETILRMKGHFGTKAEDLLVCISPSLGPDHSEFKNYRTEWPEQYWPFQIKPTYFDLWAIARHQLEEMGVLSHHIEIAQMDTYSDADNFFSYRRERRAGRTQEITGSHGTVIALNKS